MLVLEIVFVGQCEVFVCLDFVDIFFFPLGREAYRYANGVSVLQKMPIVPTAGPLKNLQSISTTENTSMYSEQYCIY